MTYTLFDAMLDVVRKLGVTFEGKATGGTTTVINDQDAASNDLIYQIGYWKGGTAFIFRTTDGLAPQGEVTGIQNNSGVTGGTVIFNLNPALTAVVQSGDYYAVTNRRYTRFSVQAAVNTALQDLGVIPVTDISSLTVADDTTEYTLPVGAGLDLREVWVQTNADVSNYRWRKLQGWTVDKKAAGVGETLILSRQEESGMILKLVYMAAHAELTTPSDVIDEAIHPDRVIYPAIVNLLMGRMGRRGRDSESLTNQIQYYRNFAEEVRSRHPINAPGKPARLLTVRKV